MATGKRLHRSSDDKWIAGVCGGFAEYLYSNTFGMAVSDSIQRRFPWFAHLHILVDLHAEVIFLLHSMGTTNNSTQ